MKVRELRKALEGIDPELPVEIELDGEAWDAETAELELFKRRRLGYSTINVGDDYWRFIIR